MDRLCTTFAHPRKGDSRCRMHRRPDSSGLHAAPRGSPHHPPRQQIRPPGSATVRTGVSSGLSRLAKASRPASRMWNVRRTPYGGQRSPSPGDLHGRPTRRQGTTSPRHARSSYDAHTLAVGDLRTDRRRVWGGSHPRRHIAARSRRPWWPSPEPAGLSRPGEAPGASPPRFDGAAPGLRDRAGPLVVRSRCARPPRPWSACRRCTSGTATATARERRSFADEVVRQVTKGRAVLCVSQDVAGAVPRSIRTVAEATLALTQPCADDIALALSIVRGGRGPSGVPPDLGKGSDLHEIAACLRGGEAPRVTVARIRKAMTGKEDAGADLTALRLGDLHGYAEAAAWGRRVVSEVDHFRAGRVPWRDVTGPAVLHGPPGTGKTLYSLRVGPFPGCPARRDVRVRVALAPSAAATWARPSATRTPPSTTPVPSCGTGKSPCCSSTRSTACRAGPHSTPTGRRGGARSSTRSLRWWTVRRPTWSESSCSPRRTTSRAVDPALLRPVGSGRPSRCSHRRSATAPGWSDTTSAGPRARSRTSELADVLRALAGATQARAAAWAKEAARSARAAGRPVALGDRRGGRLARRRALGRPAPPRRRPRGRPRGGGSSPGARPPRSRCRSSRPPGRTGAPRSSCRTTRCWTARRSRPRSCSP